MAAQANSRFIDRRHGERRVVHDALAPRPPLLRQAVPVKLSLSDRWSIAQTARRLMVAVFAGVGVLGAAVAILLSKPVFEARLRLTPSYAEPSQANGVEAALQSDMLAKAVIGQLGARRLFPQIEAHGDRGRQEAVAAFHQALQVQSPKDGGTIEISFRAHEARLAGGALKALVASYDARQRDLSGSFDDAPLAEQRRALESRMAVASEAMRAFLKANKLGDYPTDLASAIALADALAHDVAVGRADVAEIEARLQTAPDASTSARLNADLAARAQKVAALQREMIAASARVNRLRALGPDYERLHFAQQTVAAAAARSSAKDEDVRSDPAILRDPVLIAAGEPHVARTNGLQLPLGLLAVLLAAAISAVCAGLGRSFGADLLPTPTAAERHLGLPVLVVAPRASA